MAKKRKREPHSEETKQRMREAYALRMKKDKIDKKERKEERKREEKVSAGLLRGSGLDSG